MLMHPYGEDEQLTMGGTYARTPIACKGDDQPRWPATQCAARLRPAVPRRLPGADVGSLWWLVASAADELT
jgi:hypothetical protein